MAESQTEATDAPTQNNRLTALSELFGNNGEATVTEQDGVMGDYKVEIENGSERVCFHDKYAAPLTTLGFKQQSIHAVARPALGDDDEPTVELTVYVDDVRTEGI